MIGIKLTGDTEYLDVAPDTSIEIHLENPLLGDADRLSPGSFSIPFALPGGNASPKNAARLNNPDVIAALEAYQVQQATLLVNDVPYKAGTLRAKSSAGSNRIETNFFFGLNAISEKFKTARLRDVLSELIVIDSADRLKEIYVKYIPGSGDRTITVNGKSYTASSWATIASAINADAEESIDTGQWVAYATSVTSGTTPSGHAQPFIKIKLVRVTTVLSAPFFTDATDPLLPLTVTVADDDLDDFIFDSWDLDAYYDAFDTFLNGYLTGSYPTDKLRFPTLFNANLHGEVLKTSEGINLVNAGGLLRNVPGNKLGENSIQPFLRLAWVLDKIADYFGFTLEGDFYTSIGERLLDNSVTLDQPEVYLYNNKFIWWRRSFNLNELVPDITVVDFLKAICGRYNAGIYYNEVTGKVRMQLREPIAKSYDYESIDALSSPIQGNEDLRTTGYTVRIAAEESDALSVTESITVGEAQEPIDLACGRLHGSGYIVSGGYTQGVRVSRLNNAKFGLRIFYYTGIIDNGVNEYPQALISGSDSELLYDNILIPGLHSLFHKYWLLFERNRMVVRLQVNWPLRLLLNFDWELKRRYDGLHYLVKSYKVRITSNAVSVGDVELLTMQ